MKDLMRLLKEGELLMKEADMQLASARKELGLNHYEVIARGKAILGLSKKSRLN